MNEKTIRRHQHDYHHSQRGHLNALQKSLTAKCNTTCGINLAFSTNKLDTPIRFLFLVSLSIGPKFALTIETLTHFEFTKHHIINSTPQTMFHVYLDNLQRKFSFRQKAHKSITIFSEFIPSVIHVHTEVLNQRKSHLMFAK